MMHSIDFILVFLSMFSHVNSDAVEAMQLLLELACKWGYLKEIPMDDAIYEAALWSLRPLSELAKQRGHHVQRGKAVYTEDEIHFTLQVILEPFLYQLSQEELDRIAETEDLGRLLLETPVELLNELVLLWARNRERPRVSHPPSDEPNIGGEDEERTEVEATCGQYYMNTLAADLEPSQSVGSTLDHPFFGLLFPSGPSDPSDASKSKIDRKRLPTDMPTNLNDIFGVGFPVEPRSLESTTTTNHGSNRFETPQGPMIHTHHEIEYHDFWTGDTPSGSQQPLSISETPLNDQSTPHPTWCGGQLFQSPEEMGARAGLSSNYGATMESPSRNANSSSNQMDQQNNDGEITWGIHPAYGQDHTAPQHDSDFPFVPIHNHFNADKLHAPKPLRFDDSRFNYEMWNSYSVEDVHRVHNETGCDLPVDFSDAHKTETQVIPSVSELPSIPSEFPIIQDSGREQETSSAHDEPNSQVAMPKHSLRIIQRKRGVRNLKAVVTAHAAMEANIELPPTTSMLHKVLEEQREISSYSSSELINELESTGTHNNTPQLRGYHELHQQHHNKNVKLDSERTASDSSLETPAERSGSAGTPAMGPEYYTGMAAGWEAAQKELWESRLRREYDSQMGLNSKTSRVGKVKAARRKLRSWFRL